MLEYGTKINDKGLKDLIRSFTKQKPFVKIGILGANVPRKESGITNAEIGAIHEFGSPINNIPKRSFLFEPLQDNMKKHIEKAQNLEKQKKVDFFDIMNKLGAIAKSVVQKAFTNGGYGKWEPTKKWERAFFRTGDPKKSGDILVDTGQLRDSINYEVVSP